MYDVIMMSFLSFRRHKGLKAKNVIIMFVFEPSGPKLVSMPNFSSISFKMADFSLFLGAKSCEVPSVILLPWQQLNQAGENSSFIFTVCVKSVPRYHVKLAYVIL